MFRKFDPKEDIASSTSLKSSVQRHIRTAVCEQIPFLTRPAYTEGSSAPQEAAPAPEPEAQAEETAAEAVEEKSKGGKGSKKKGGAKAEKKGKGKNAGEEKEESGGATEQLQVIDEIWPKKEAIAITKCRDHVTIYTLDGTPLVFQHFDGPLIPNLKILHQYPEMLPKVRIDRGAIKFLLAGANMMAPGLLSAGGELPPGLAANTVVAIHAEGKEHAAGIGKLAASSEEIQKAGKGVAVEVMCYLGDDLWKIDKL